MGATVPGATRAYYQVSKAVARGDLPPVRDLLCVDCGSQAAEYDHRDYNKPLQVDPVCCACNNQRGAGIPLGCVSYTHGYSSGYVVTPERVRTATFQVVDFGRYEG